MKAAVIFQKGEMPRYVDFPEPIVQNEEELLISVKAAAIKHVDKSRASGKHYSTKDDISRAKIIGGDGVGLLGDGTRVYSMGVSGMIAEKAIVDKRTIVKLPDGIDDATAAALPNAVAGSAMALRFRAAMKTGETVLINGATGFTGKVAIQVAKRYGAKKIIVTGRNERILQSLKELGADETIFLKQDDDALIGQFKGIHEQAPIDIILDYLWGHTAEILLSSLMGNGSFTHPVRFVSVGAMTGDKIQLSAENLRSVDLQITGSGLGSWSKSEISLLFTEMLPEMLQLAAENKIKLETEAIRLSDIEKIWDMEIPDGKRLVVII